MTRHLAPALLLMAACTPDPPPAPRPTQTPAAAIPADLQGRFGRTAAACAPGATAAELRGLLTIGGDALAFGLAPQTVDRVAPRDGRVVFDTTDTAGDTTERRRYAFAVSRDRRTLTRVEAGRPDLVYTRCPNQPS